MANHILTAKQRRPDGDYDVNVCIIWELTPAPLYDPTSKPGEDDYPRAMFSSRVVPNWFRVASGVTREDLAGIDDGTHGVRHFQDVQDEDETDVAFLTRIRGKFARIAALYENAARTGSDIQKDLTITVVRQDR